MQMISKQLFVFIGIALFSVSSMAHKRWLLPSDFSLSDAETVIVDYSASNNLFYVDKAMPLNDLRVLDPAGNEMTPSSVVNMSRRTSAEIAIDQPGSYRLQAGRSPMYFAAWQVPGEKQPQRARGSLASLKEKIPANATQVKWMQSVSCIETYISLGEPDLNAQIKQPASQGLSMVPVSHPNLAYSDEPTKLRFFLNGEAAANLTVTVTPEGTRYRDTQGDQQFRTDAEGYVTLHWPGAGRFLVEAEHAIQHSEGQFAETFFSYYLTLEVLHP